MMDIRFDGAMEEQYLDAQQIHHEEVLVLGGSSQTMKPQHNRALTSIEMRTKACIAIL